MERSCQTIPCLRSWSVFWGVPGKLCCKLVCIVPWLRHCCPASAQDWVSKDIALSIKTSHFYLSFTAYSWRFSDKTGSCQKLTAVACCSFCVTFSHAILLFWRTKIWVCLLETPVEIQHIYISLVIVKTHYLNCIKAILEKDNGLLTLTPRSSNTNTLSWWCTASVVPVNCS